MTIMQIQDRPSEQPAVSCPPWCFAHIPGDTSVLHCGDENVVELSAYGELHDVHLTLEQGEHLEDGQGIVAIRMNDNPMTPTEALELAAALTHLAQRALFR